MTAKHSVAAATFHGLIAVALWATLAALSTYAGPIPPFQLNAMTFLSQTFPVLSHVPWPDSIRRCRDWGRKLRFAAAN